MKKFILFWKKDIINKLIVLTSMLLVAGAFAFIFMVLNMPEGKSFRDALSQILPVQSTADPLDGTTSTPAVTETPLLFNVMPTPVQGIVDLTPTLDPALFFPTFASEAATVTPQASIPAASSTPEASLNGDCIPKHPAQTAKVVSVLDGNTINVLLDGLVYVVRYIGVASPEDPALAERARLENASLVFGKDVTLIADQSDKDVRGRLLRYVQVGDTFVNLKLLQQGLVSALDLPPDSACAQTFKQADQISVSVPSGIFNTTPTASATPEE